MTGPGPDHEDMRAALRGLYDALRADMRGRWHRDLPFEELLFDRWERARDLGFGEGSSIYHNSYVYGDVAVGANTWIGPFTMLDGSGGLTIGDWCSISSGVHIYTHDTVAWAVSGGRTRTDPAAVRVGSFCYIGSQAVVAKGVSIGDHAVIGAASFVNRDVPAFTVAAGVPAYPIGRVVLADDGAVSLEYEARAPQPR